MVKFHLFLDRHDWQVKKKRPNEITQEDTVCYGKRWVTCKDTQTRNMERTVEAAYFGKVLQMFPDQSESCDRFVSELKHECKFENRLTINK